MKIRGNTVGTTIKPEKTVVKCETLVEEEKAIARANIGASSTIVVTIDENNKASHTPNEIYQHVQNGGLVVLDAGFEMYMNLTSAESYIVHFSYLYMTQDTGGADAVAMLADFIIDLDGNVDSRFMNLWDSMIIENYIYDQLGPIDSALDAILKIQNELIGGDDV